jgi:hypothetical protein
MAGKSNHGKAAKPPRPPGTARVKQGSRISLAACYPSLAQGPTPAERLQRLLADARQRGCRPMTTEEFDRWIEEGRAIWPEDEEIDAFVAWVRKCRQQGYYN